MPPDNAPPRKRRPPRPPLGPKVLAALVSGASVQEIAASEGLPNKKVEKLLRDELRKRWVAPAQDYARLQIARLEAILAKLKLKTGEGDLRVIDRILRIHDRLDRYHGFGRLLPGAKPLDEEARKRLVDQLRIAGGAHEPPEAAP